MDTNVTELPPRGAYSAAEAGQLAGVSGDRIGQWARRGYIQASVSSTVPHIYSFQDVAEAFVMNVLTTMDIELSSIKAAIDHIRATEGRNWPLSNSTLHVVSEHPQATGAKKTIVISGHDVSTCLLYTSPSPRDATLSRMPSSA